METVKDQVPIQEKQIDQDGIVGGVIQNKNYEEDDMINKIIDEENLKNRFDQGSQQNENQKESIHQVSNIPNDTQNEKISEIKQNQVNNKSENSQFTNDKINGRPGIVQNSQQNTLQNDRNQQTVGVTINKNTEAIDSVVNNIIQKSIQDESLVESHILSTADDIIQSAVQTENQIKNLDQQQHQPLLTQAHSQNEQKNRKSIPNKVEENVLYQSDINSQSPDIKLLKPEQIQQISSEDSSTLINSITLDSKNEISEQRDNTIQRSQSHFLNDGIASQQQNLNNKNLLSTSQSITINDSPSPSTSLFAQMSKQQSRKDIKNWSFGKSFNGSQRGSSNLSNSAVLPNSGVNAASNSISQFILQKKVSVQQGQGLNDCSQLSLDESVGNSSFLENHGESIPAESQLKKSINIQNNKKPIKFMNTKSTELKKYNFFDDDIINIDEKLYINLAQSYNINKNIGISVKTSLNYQASPYTQILGTPTNNSQISQIQNSPQKLQNQEQINIVESQIQTNNEDKIQLADQQSGSFKNNNSNNTFDNHSNTNSSSHKNTNVEQYQSILYYFKNFIHLQTEKKKANLINLTNINNSIRNERDNQVEYQKSGILETPPKFEYIPQSKKVLIPVLLSVKTEEQMLSYQYIEQFEQNKSEKDIRSLNQIEIYPKSKKSTQSQSPSKVHIIQEESQTSLQNENQISREEDDLNQGQAEKFVENEAMNPQENQKSKTEIQLNEDAINKEDQSQQDEEEENEQTNEQGQSKKISQKNILMKSIQSKAKKTKDKLLKQINEQNDEKPEEQSSQVQINQQNTFSGLSPFQQQPMRFPIDLICVIDTSGSMDGQPLNLLKETLLFLVDLLQSGDRICLIQFSTNAKRLTPILSIDSKDNIEKIKGEINNLIAKGGTNINQGMQLAFDVLKQRRYKNPITSVFLLSDGLNDGAENRIRDLLKQLNFYQNYNEENFTIQTFGFGKDHDPNLMDKISQLMDGNFYYIGDIHRIDECFIDALGGLFSVISQNVSIKVSVPKEMRNQIRIVKTYGDIWQVKEQFYEYVININQLLCGVSKDYILEIELDQKIIEDSQCIQEIHSEEDFQSSEQIGSQRSFTKFNSAQVPSHLFPNLLETYLKASHISLNTNHNSSFTPQVTVEKNQKQNIETLKQNQPSAPEFMQDKENENDNPTTDCQQDVQNTHSETLFKTSSNTEIQERPPSNTVSKFSNYQIKSEQKNQINNCPYSQTECSQQISISIIPTVIEENNYCAASNLKQANGKSIVDFNNDFVIKNETLNLKNQKQIQENLVKLHYLRVKGAEGLEKCQSLALQKRFDEGNEYINRLLSELNEQPEETRKQLQKLIIDLTEAQDTLKKKVSEQIGWHRMISCKRMHMEQRSTGTDLAYQNSVQKIMVQRRKSLKDANSMQSMSDAVSRMYQVVQQGVLNIQGKQNKRQSEEISNNKDDISSSGSSEEEQNQNISETSSPQKYSPDQSQSRKKQTKAHTINPILKDDSIQKQEKQQQNEECVQQISQNNNS